MNSVHQEQSSGSSPSGRHEPVLLAEAMRLIQPRSGGVYLDATVGLGGHSQGILEASAPSGRLLGLDQDASALSFAFERLSRFRSRCQLVHANYARIREVATQCGFVNCDAILADVGVSSLQLDTAARGFSFLKDGPLDMRMDLDLPLTAAEVVNLYREQDLANLIYQYGEEPQSRRIARAIVKARPFSSTKQLADLIARAVGRLGSRRIHPATRTFQALRIHVNDELNRLATFLRNAVDLLVPGGRIVVITFHSLEDRVVKDAFRSLSRGCTCPPGLPQCACGNQRILEVLTRKPIRPGGDEVSRNPRSRSAKLRAAERLRHAAG
ncbi:MAG: 16S rRNA (cytosine(1402)-N(4))-methyltransferase RsmH [Acidobacteriota bacterium]